MRRIMMAAVACMLTVVVIAGCTGAKQEQEQEQIGSTGGDSKAGADPVELTYWMHQNAAFEKANRKLIEDFEAQHPNVTIKLEIFPYDDYIQKIRTAYAGNEAPDIAQVFGTWVTPLAKAGLLYELPGAEELKSRLYEASTGAYVVDGKMFGVPREYNSNGGLLVDPAIFKEAGLEYPATWDELMNAAKTLTVTDANGNITRKGFDFTSSDSVMLLFLNLILQQGGNFWTEDQMVKLTTPEAATALAELRDMVTVDKVTDLKSMGGPLNTFDYFYKGQTAIDFDGSWVVPLGKDVYGRDDFDYIAIPSYTDKPPYFVSESGWGEIVSSRSKHPEEAVEFVNFITTKENNMYWNSQTGTIPAEKAIAEDPSYVEANAKIKASFDVLPYGTWIGPLENRDFFCKQIFDGFYMAVEGAPIEQALQKMEDEINKMIAKERK